MKVLYLNNWLSGTWQVQKIHAEEFVNAFKEIKGVHLFTYPKNENSSTNNKRLDRKHKILGDGKEFFKKIAPGFIHQNLIKLSETKKLINIKKEIDSIKPDVILVRNNLFYFQIMNKLSLLGVPVVIEINGLFKNDAEWIKIENSEEIIKIEKEIINNANAICCVSRSIAESLKLCGTEPKKIFIVPNGVDPLKFYPRKKSERLSKKYSLAGKIVIGYVGGFENEKEEGRDVIGLLKAFKIIEKTSKIPIELLLVGKMDKNYLNQKIKDLNINELVTLTGHIKHDQLPNIMNLIDIAVAPYFERRLKDASPMKLFEYMAMEKPVIIPGVGQVAEITLNMESAVLVEPDNISSLADSLGRLIENDYLREKIGKNARRLIKKKYTWAHNARHIAKACQFAIETNKSISN